MLRKRLFYAIITFAMMLVCLTPAEAVTFNGLEYTQYSGQWYQICPGDTFAVIGTTIWVQFYDGTREGQIDTLNTQLDGEIVAIFPSEDYNVDDDIYLIQSTADPEPDPLDFMEDYLDSPLVESGRNQTEVHFCQSNDPGMDLDNDDFLQRYLISNVGDPFDNTINIDPAWDITTGSNTVLVGIVDQGYLFGHSELVDNVWQNEGEDIGGVDGTIVWDEENDVWILDPGDLNDEDDDLNGWVDDLIGQNVNPNFGEPENVGDDPERNERMTQHGTPIAGIIAARSNNESQFAGIAGGWGAADGVKIVFAKTGPPSEEFGRIPEQCYIEGLRYLIDVGVDIINMSNSFNDSELILAQIERAVNADILMIGAVVQAARAAVNYPASDPSVLAVGCSRDDDFAEDGNWGEDMELMAPSWFVGAGGIEHIIFNTYTDQDENGDEFEVEEEDFEEMELTGSSFSAAQATGVAALLLSVEPNLTISNFIEIMNLTAMRVDDQQHGYALDVPDHPFGAWDNRMGYGELDAGNAVVSGRRQEIQVAEGWNWISSRMEPYFTEDNEMDDENGIYLTFAEIEDDLILLKNGGGLFWNTEFEFCNIPSWNYLDGYKVNMDAAGTLVVLGRLEVAEEPIPLSLGWNLVAYFPTVDLDEWDGFDNLIDEESLIQAKNQAGQFLIPAYEDGGPFSNMVDLSPGSAYAVKVDGATDLIYPVGQQAQPPEDNSEKRIASYPKHFLVAARTDDFHSVLITSLALENIEVTTGDEIGLFADGTCIGSSVVTGEFPMGLAIWRDDTLTVERDGYRQDDIFTLYYWSESEDTEYGPDTLEIFGNIDYSNNPDLTVTDLNFNSVAVSIPSSFTLQAAYPNPFNASTTLRFDIPEAGAVDIAIYSEDGRLVRELNSREVHAGQFSWVWNGRNQSGGPVSSGVYLLRVNYHGQSGVMARESIKLVAVK